MSRSLTDLAELCAMVEAEPGMKKKADLVGSFLTSLEPDDIKPVVLILLAQVLPESEKRALEVGYSKVKRAVGSGQTTLFSEERVSMLEAYVVLQRIAKDRLDREGGGGA